MTSKTIKPCSKINGTVKLLGDKSISHRALILSAIANGTSEIKGISVAEDVNDTKSCLENLGVNYTEKDGVLTAQGVGMNGLQAPSKELYVGNSGTTIRLLSGLLAAQNFDTTLKGDDSLNNRPMRRIIEPLELMGANITSTDYKAPMTISGGPLRAIDYASRVASAQVKSCILFAGLYAKGMTRVTEPSQSRDHSERMLKDFGVKIQHQDGLSGVRGPSELTATNIDVPGDMSAAAFFIAAACLLPDSEITIPNVGVNLTRTGILEALTAMGASIERHNDVELNNEPRADIVVRSTNLYSTNLNGVMIPRIIDEIPILAVLASQAQGATYIKDAHELRVKESDRITAIVKNLKKMGANIRELKDGMVIEGPNKLKGAEIATFGDHRIAMSFAIAGLIAEGETVLDNVDCVNTSFPGFFELLESVCE